MAEDRESGAEKFDDRPSGMDPLYGLGKQCRRIKDYELFLNQLRA